jgi:hypothetical protein
VTVRDDSRFGLAQGTIPTWNTLSLRQSRVRQTINRDKLRSGFISKGARRRQCTIHGSSPLGKQHEYHWRRNAAWRPASCAWSRVTSRAKLAHLQGSTRVPPILERSLYRLRIPKRRQRAKRAEVVAKNAFVPTQTNTQTTDLKANVNKKADKSFRLPRNGFGSADQVRLRGTRPRFVIGVCNRVQGRLFQEKSYGRR